MPLLTRQTIVKVALPLGIGVGLLVCFGRPVWVEELPEVQPMAVQTPQIEAVRSPIVAKPTLVPSVAITQSRKVILPPIASNTTTVPIIMSKPSPSAGMPKGFDEPPESKAPSLAVGRELRLKELLDQADKDPNPQTAQRTRLTIAGYFVGDGKWEDARKVYEKLAESPFVEVRHAASRNLQVVMKNIALEGEKDFERREWLQLELAALHQSLGHEKFAKTMLRNLKANSIQDVVRQRAAQRLASYVTSPLPTLPENPDRDKP